MIDTAMLTRLMVLTGFAPPETPAPQATKEMLTLARAIWTEAQNDEREVCAKICTDIELTDSARFGDDFGRSARECCAQIRERSNAEFRGGPASSARPLE